jgi:hypothetical protein
MALQLMHLGDLDIIENAINKYQRNEGEVLEGYLSKKLDELEEEIWSFQHINLLISPASSGKTTMVEGLKEKGNRCLLFVPTRAIIKNKRLKGFVPVYDNTSMQKYVHTTESIICTFDKARQLKVNDLTNFDYIIVDEFHLLFTEQYRLNAMVSLLKIINTYILNVRDNMPEFTKPNRIVLMSGTPVCEELFFGFDKNGEPFTQKKEFINNRERKVTLVGCKDFESFHTSFINKTIEELANEHRVLITSNMGEKWINCIKAQIGNPNSGIYSNNQKNSQVSRDINSTSKISDDVDLLFMTSLGNVGIDINNTDKPTTMLVYFDIKFNQITGQIVEQYANRFRKINIEIFVFFIIPDRIEIPDKKFVFNHAEDPFVLELIKNDISTNLHSNTHFTQLMERNEADPYKVKWKAFVVAYRQFASNIISVGGYLKTMGYEITVIEGDEKDTSIIDFFFEQLKFEKHLEKGCKIETLNFILDNIDILTRSLTGYIRETGKNAILDKTITIENEQIFNKVRYLARYCVRIIGSTGQVDWIRTFMINEEMDSINIQNRLKYMEFINSENVDYLDDMFVFEVDKLAKMKNGKGSLTKQQFYDMLNVLAPKYINKLYNDTDPSTQSVLREKLKEKIDICYIIKKSGEKVTVNQRYTQVWIDETNSLFRDIKNLFGLTAFVNERKERNRKGLAVGLAVGKAVGDAIGKAYVHIPIDTIDQINKIVEVDGFITAKTINEITGLTSRNVGGFVKSKLPNLKSSVKMINRVRETWYS